MVLPCFCRKSFTQSLYTKNILHAFDPLRPKEAYFVLRTLIQSKRPRMSDRQGRIADLILHSPREAAFMTATELASAAGVSEATVIRFAYFLGFSGYHALRDAVKEMLMDHLSTLERLQKSAPGEGKAQAADAVRTDLATLSSYQGMLIPEAVDELGTALAGAPAVYIAGYRSSYSLAYYLSFYLSWLLPNVSLIGEDVPYEMLVNAPAGSVVVGISFPRYSRWTVDVLTFARNSGLTVAAVTDSSNSPLACQAQYLMTVAYQPVSFVDSLTTPLCALNGLILSVANHLDGVRERLERLEHIWTDQGVYATGTGHPGMTVQGR